MEKNKENEQVLMRLGHHTLTELDSEQVLSMKW